MQMLDNFGAKRNLIILYFLILSLTKNRFCATETEGAHIYRHCKQIQHFSKNWNIARNIMCFIMIVVIARQNFSAYLVYLTFSKFSYR